MKDRQHTIRRRALLKSACGGAAAAILGGTAAAAASGSVATLSAEHQRCVNRRRRIVVQYDCQTLFGLDFAAWLDYRFRYIDEPGTQIDSVWWDMGRLGQVLYTSKFLDRLSHPGLEAWRRQGIDLVGRLVEQTRRRNLEVFWHHRVSEVDMDRRGEGAAWKDPADPLKRAHPDWVLKTWWPHGLWNFAGVAVREHTVKAIQEVVEMYDFDGVQLDFARHVPCLPPGRQWELRHHVTDLMRSVRQMLLERAAKRGRPLLLAAKVPQTLEGCRVDGFDVEQWMQESLVDIFTLGSRSLEVDLAAFRRIRAGRNIKLQPCFDDHHTSDAYRHPPIEVFRGVFANWWQQGADSVATFNWSNAPAELAQRLGDPPSPLSQRLAYREVGDPQSMRHKDKTFVVERRGGYPWAEGFFNRNDTAPLPLALTRGGEEKTVGLRVGDDLRSVAGRLRQIVLRAVFYGADPGEEIEVRLNGHVLPLLLRDPAWKDSLIFSPDPQPASGGDYPVNPRQRLLRLEFVVEATQCRLEMNQVALRVLKRAAAAPAAKVALEKLELDVKYA